MIRIPGASLKAPQGSEMKTLLLLLLIVGIALFCSAPLSAQQRPHQEVYKILGVSVEGNALADPAAVIANSGLKVGDEIAVPGEQVAQAVRRLWGLKLFEDIQISIDRKAWNGVYLLITVKELPRYERTEITGRDELSESVIEKKINFVRGQVFAPQEAVRIRKEIKKLYEKEGFLLADIKVEAIPVDTSKNRIVLKITIDEGKEVQVDHITFEGNSAFTAGDLRGAMDDIAEKHWWKFW